MHARFKTLRDANFDLMKLCEEHDTSYERGRLDMQQYRYVLTRRGLTCQCLMLSALKYMGFPYAGPEVERKIIGMTLVEVRVQIQLGIAVAALSGRATCACFIDTICRGNHAYVFARINNSTWGWGQRWSFGMPAFDGYVSPTHIRYRSGRTSRTKFW